MQIIAGLMRMGYPASEVMRVLTLEDNLSRDGRNDPCPCGSGRKFKRCHGQQKADQKGEIKYE